MEMQFGEYIKVNEEGHLEIDGCDCVELADKYGTPLFVTSERMIRFNYHRLNNAFTSRYPDVVVCYGNKANNSLAIRKILKHEGAGGDCFGEGELFLNLLAGVSPDKIVLNGSGKSVRDLKAGIEAGVIINVDNPQELELINEYKQDYEKEIKINFRIRPFLHDLKDEFITDYRYSNPKINAAKWFMEKKFGMDLETAFQACRRALSLKNIKLRGLHCHMHGQTTKTEHMVAIVNESMAFAARLKKELKFEIKEVDFGGGFPIGRKEGYGPMGRDSYVPDIDEFAVAIVTTFKEKLKEYRFSNRPILRIEPGRYLVGNTTVLLGRVGIIKETQGLKKWAHTDISVNHLPRISTANWVYHVAVANRVLDESQETMDIVGPTCSAADVIRSSVKLPKLVSGDDLIAVFDVGAYAECTSCTFNSLPRPATLLANNGSADVITERETFQDIIKLHRIPVRLLV